MQTLKSLRNLFPKLSHETVFCFLFSYCFCQELFLYFVFTLLVHLNVVSVYCSKNMNGAKIADHKNSKNYENIPGSVIFALSIFSGKQTKIPP